MIPPIIQIVNSTEKSLEVEAEPWPTNYMYTCEVQFGQLIKSPKSKLKRVQGMDILSVTMHGSTRPVQFAGVEFTCEAEMGALAEPPNIRWFHKNAITPIPSNEKYNILIPKMGNPQQDGKWFCVVTTGNKQLRRSNTIDVTVIDYVRQPSLETPNYIQKGGSYTLHCKSPSHTPFVKYKWEMTQNGVNWTTLSNTEKDYTITSASKSHAGQYKCLIEAEGSKSPYTDPSRPIFYIHKTGRLCTSLRSCASDVTLYTGNCVDMVCTCVQDAILETDGCSRSLSGARSISSWSSIYILNLLCYTVVWIVFK